MTIHVIGLSVGAASNSFVDLSSDARRALDASEVVIGSERQLELVEQTLGEEKHASVVQLVLPKLKELEGQLKSLSKEYTDIAILASGDPLYFGIGKWLSERCKKLSIPMQTYAGVSSIQAACHRLSWSLQDCQVISLHGRPLENLKPLLEYHSKLICLTDAQSSPRDIARLLDEVLSQKQVDQVKVSVCEKMGYPEENVRHFSVSELVNDDSLQFDALHVSCIDLPFNEGMVERRNKFNVGFPGIADTDFVTDKGEGRGMLTKRDVRLSILSRIAPSDGDVIWDIGAGCGGVSVELASWQSNISVYAIEQHAERLACLEQNRIKFGVEERLSIVNGYAPEVCEDLPKPNKIFIGGSGGHLESILTEAWKALPENGVLVASAVTEATRLSYSNYRPENGVLEGQTEISTRTAQKVGSEVVLKPALPVQIFCWRKLTDKKAATSSLEKV